MATFGFLAACAMTLSGLAGCSTTTEGGEGVEEGEETTMKISIPIVTTYADNDANATAAEVAFVTADIFIYNETGTSREQHVSLSASDFEKNTTLWKWEMKNPITVLSGNKKIYVGLNLPAAAKTVILNEGVQGVYGILPVAPDSLPTLRDAIVNPGSGFAMFSTPGTGNTDFVVIPGVANPAGEGKNEFSVSVERWASKIISVKAATLNTVASGATFLTAPGAVDANLSFSIGNVNTKLYPFQKKIGANIEDPNYTPPTPPFTVAQLGEYVNDFGRATGGTTSPSYPAGYSSVDTTSAFPPPAIDARTPKYAVENTSASPYYQGLLTYVSVRARFYPNEIITAFTAGATDSLSRDNTISSVQNDLYVYTTPGGEYLYFTNATVGAAWAAAYDGETFQGNYKDGYCYYLVYLDPKTAYSAAPYASVRNLLYCTMITKINSLGYPNPGEPDPETPLGVTTKLTVDVVITPWTFVAMDDIHLGLL
ncbi:MAG: Mfa1 family fimbria major subunit [Tannerella sp.]|jgi:hypothetical protein|nr:Mfa1 family fimbria major subunit [Tannerella sp.]